MREKGKDRIGKQRYICDNEECGDKTFGENYTYNAYEPKVKSGVFLATVNGSGIMAIARTEKISKNTVKKILKSAEADIWYINYNYIEKLKKGEITGRGSKKLKSPKNMRKKSKVNDDGNNKNMHISIFREPYSFANQTTAPCA